MVACEEALTPVPSVELEAETFLGGQGLHTFGSESVLPGRRFVTMITPEYAYTSNAHAVLVLGTEQTPCNRVGPMS